MMEQSIIFPASIPFHSFQMDIDKLLSQGDISVRSYNVCMDSDLYTIDDLVAFYRTHLTFKKLRNCGELTNTQLKQVVIENINDLDVSNEHHESKALELTRMYDLFRSGKIDQRSYNVCRFNKIANIGDCCDYFLDNLTFKTLRNCGEKSNSQLISFLESDVLNHRQEIAKTAFEDYQKADSDIKTRILTYVGLTTSGLDDKSLRTLKSFLGTSDNPSLICESILTGNFYKIYKLLTPPTIHGSQQIAYTEIVAFNQELKKGILSILYSENSNDEVFSTLLSGSDDDKPITTNSIFQLTKSLLDGNRLFDQLTTDIINLSLNLYTNQAAFSLEEIAKSTNTYQGKITKVRNSSLSMLPQKLAVLRAYENQLSSKYQVDSDGDFLIIDDLTAKQINSVSETTFSKPFITLILSVFLNREFVLIGNLEDALILKPSHPRFRHEWKNLYLIRRGLDQTFNFEAMAEDITKRLEEKINESYSFNLNSYLSRFGDVTSLGQYDSIIPFAELLIHDEFGLSVDLEDNLTFERNTLKKVHEYAMEALLSIGVPSKVETIHSKVLEMSPDFNKDKASIQAAMTRSKGFVPIGRRSMYGLKQWEGTIENFKGGTIRNIIKEYLDERASPIHLNELTKHVLVYRPKSNKTSILTNLQIDSSNTFHIYKGHYIGLVSKDYSQYPKLTRKASRSEDNYTWEENYERLQSFIESNNRLPFSSGCPESEIRLYRWYSIQRRSHESGKLTGIKKERIGTLLDEYGSSNARGKQISLEPYEKLFSLLEEHGRMPNSRIEGESQLYHFFQRRNTAYNEGRMSTDEQTLFKNIKNKIIQIEDEHTQN